ncbi:hypothetical protein QJS10_CPB17g01285 [Acorus calamus]|uniref:Uncharacterized protein n=1 Tax=Acorus calamus TaxID=4465 RepID=A0AAV9CXG8_ACOCL|nr:hypothetical protein QJS10_CPB17g01285 [Acorus calamus]
MEGGGPYDYDVPCSSFAVESFLTFGAAGSAWGLLSGSHEARHIGLTGGAQASFVAKSFGKYGLQCGLFGAAFASIRCFAQEYRMKKDWVNAGIAGAVVGGALGVRSRNWKQVCGGATLVATAAAISSK